MPARCTFMISAGGWRDLGQEGYREVLRLDLGLFLYLCACLFVLFKGCSYESVSLREILSLFHNACATSIAPRQLLVIAV
mmetsp:Transcript_39181/g.63149  ORF Transcript_39181/g.63149 Transcript_39181/m.63149 type:complete len:80 (+) Transcript_39181:177-416(+)